MKTKDLVNWIKLFIKFSKKFINGFTSNNLMIFELQNILSKIKLIDTKISDPIHFSVTDIVYVDSLIYSFRINNVVYVIDGSNINSTIENVISLRNFFKNIYDYYLHFEKDLIAKINFSTDIMSQTYLNISDILLNFKNKVMTQSQNIDLLTLFLALVRSINQNYKFPKLFKFREKTVDLQYFSKYDSFQKTIVCQINLITLNKFFDETIINSDSESINESINLDENSCISTSSSESIETLKYTIFKKNKISKTVFNDFVLKIGTNSVRINSTAINRPNFLFELDFIINEINDSVTKILNYKTFVQTYEISIPVIIKKNIFSKQKCFYLQELYQGIIEFLCLLNTDIENLYVLSQIESEQNKTIVSVSLQNIINNLYVRLYDLISSSFPKISILMGDINVNIYYMDENSCVLFFGVLNVPKILVEKDGLDNIKFIELFFSTQSFKIESLKNKMVPKNFSTVLLSLINNIQVLKTLLEFDLKNLSDLILLLRSV